MMNCEEAREKVSALIDNEIESNEVPTVISHLESCYNCREEYIELLRLEKQLKGINVPEPAKEWFEEIQAKLPRKVSGFIGKFFFFASYILLIGYAVYQFFMAPGEDLILKIIIGGIIAGFLILLGVSVADRVHEKKTDRYKGVMK